MMSLLPQRMVSAHAECAMMRLRAAGRIAFDLGYGAMAFRAREPHQRVRNVRSEVIPDRQWVWYRTFTAAPDTSDTRAVPTRLAECSTCRRAGARSAEAAHAVPPIDHRVRVAAAVGGP